MTEGELNYLEHSVELQLHVLRLISTQYNNDQLIDEFHEVVRETKEKIIWDLENYFLNPELTFNPLERTFKLEDEPIRIEIAEEVNTHFQNFLQELND
jgi:hypothetical protein